MPAVTLYPISESAITIQFDSVISPENLKRILSYQRVIEQNKFDGFIESVPAYASLTLYFNPIKVMQSTRVGLTPYEKVSNYINSLNIVVDDIFESRTIDVPVCYDAEFGLDLIELANALQLSTAEIIEKHSSKIYTVFMVGFTPGFPYMGELDESLHCTRKASPRKKIPAGSVAIAGKQTGIYPFETPGGWQIIGRTPLQLFDVGNNPPSIFQSGMQVKFVPISRSDFDKLSHA